MPNTSKLTKIEERAFRSASKGRYQDALQDFNVLIKLRPNADTYINRGAALAFLGQQADAIADFNRALQLKPDSAEAYFNRGCAYRAMGGLQAALEDFRQAIALKPGCASAYVNSGLVHLVLGEPEAALKLLDQAIALDPKSLSAWNNRGMVRKTINDYQGAIEDFTQAISLQPECAGAYSNRGATRALLEPPDIEGAIRDVYHACDLFLQQGDKTEYQEACHLLQSLLIGESLEESEFEPIKCTPDECAAALVAGFDPETGEQLFNRGYILDLVDEYKSAQGQERKELLLEIGQEAGLLTSGEIEVLKRQLPLEKVEQCYQKVKHFIQEQIATPVDSSPFVCCELNGPLAIFIHKRLEAGKTRYGYSFATIDCLIANSESFQPYTDPESSAQPEFKQVLANARNALLTRNPRLIQSSFHQDTLLGNFYPNLEDLC